MPHFQTRPNNNDWLLTIYNDVIYIIYPIKSTVNPTFFLPIVVMTFQHVRSPASLPPSRSCARIPSALCQLAPLEHALTAALRHTSGMLGIPRPTVLSLRLWRSSSQLCWENVGNYETIYIIYKYIYITWNTVIKYAIIIDVVHVHNILILDICIWNHQAVFGVYQCISYTYIYKICLDLALICHECHPIHLTTRRTAWSLVSWEVWKIWRLCCQ